MIIPNTRACGNVGVFGIDLYLGDLAEDITYYTSYNDSYAFLIDINGKTLAHPSFPRPIMTKEELFPIDILYLENVERFAVVRQKMLQNENGVETIGAGSNKTYKYTWQRVAQFYIICIVSFTTTTEKPVLLGKIEKYSVDHTDNGLHDLLYHRLDLLPPLQPKSMCRYIKQLATFGRYFVLLYLSLLLFLLITFCVCEQYMLNYYARWDYFSHIFLCTILVFLFLILIFYLQKKSETKTNTRC